MKPYELQLFKDVIAETCEHFGLDEFCITVSETNPDGETALYNLSNCSINKKTPVGAVASAVFNELQKQL